MNNSFSTSQNTVPDFSRPLSEQEVAPASKIEGKKQEKTSISLFGHKFGLVDLIVIAVVLACSITNQIIDNTWLGWGLVTVCAVCMSLPALIQKVQSRNKFGIYEILSQLKKMGLPAVIDGEEIRWESSGKHNVLRLINGCQLQVCREYPTQPEIVASFEAAASETMGEVFSAKIGIHKIGDGRGSIFFSTEHLCSSMKDFDKLLSASVSILDTAEERQGVNLNRIMTKNNPERRKIGFQITAKNNE